MPIEPRELLDLAKHLVAPDASEAQLRRGISTAYYSLFHLLIKAATARYAPDPDFRSRVARALQHGQMKQVCDKYNPPEKSSKNGVFVTKPSEGFPSQVIPDPLRQVAAAFFQLHAAREQADYDDSTTIQHAKAKDMVLLAENAFQSWVIAQADPASVIFLQELICKSILRR